MHIRIHINNLLIHYSYLLSYLYSFSYYHIASRIPAARPEGSLFVVPGFLSLCVRKLHYPAEEENDECLSIIPDRRTVCPSIWDDLVKKGVYDNWYHPDSLMVCLRIGMTL